jgi:glyoxylase-like metal-dependent hydrolase (beta-lactamase superfamily II)
MVDEHLFIGDVLFRGSIGRYDLPTASYNEMMNSLSILKSLKKDYIVYPGHGPKTSLFYEINNNPYLKQ